LYLARLAISQTFGLGGGRVINEAGPNELAGTRDRDQLAITVGRLSVMDVFDANAGRTIHRSILQLGAVRLGRLRLPADTRGYTWGILADLAVDWWSARAGVALLPKYANLGHHGLRIGKSHGLVAEYEARYSIGGLPGAVSVLTFLNVARMGSYEQVLSNPAAYGNDVAATRADGRTKYGFALSMEQQVHHSIGTFLRHWSARRPERIVAFTEIDRPSRSGAVFDGDYGSAIGTRPGGAHAQEGADAVVHLLFHGERKNRIWCAVGPGGRHVVAVGGGFRQHLLVAAHARHVPRT